MKPGKASVMRGCALLSGRAHPRPATCQDSLISCNYAEFELPPCLIRLSTTFLMKGRSRSPLSETFNAKSAVARVGKTQSEESSVWIYVHPSCVCSDDSESLLPVALSPRLEDCSPSLRGCVMVGRHEEKVITGFHLKPSREMNCCSHSGAARK